MPIQRLVNCIDLEVDLVVYIRERARFSDRFQAPEQHFLKFSFLAFELESGTVSRFVGPKELNMREKLLLNEGFSLRESELCRVYFRATGNEDIERALNLLMRIVVAFYRNV